MQIVWKYCVDFVYDYLLIFIIVFTDDFLPLFPPLHPFPAQVSSFIKCWYFYRLVSFLRVPPHPREMAKHLKPWNVWRQDAYANAIIYANTDANAGANGDADTNAKVDADANADVNANAYASQLLTPPTRPMLSPTLSFFGENGKVEIVKHLPNAQRVLPNGFPGHLKFRKQVSASVSLCWSL